MTDQDTDIKIWIERAEEVKTSGRWKAINTQIERLAQDADFRFTHFEGAKNDWMFEVFAGLCAQTFEEYLGLKAANDEATKNRASEISWRARNLLELFVWVAYCSKSTTGARRFYDDAGRDMRDLADGLIKWGEATKQGADWLKDISEGKEILKSKMSARGIEGPDEKYTRVEEAAKEIGMLENYRISNKMLSKFTHPTAAVVLRPPNFTEALREFFYAKGCMYFCGAIDILEIWIMGSAEEQAQRKVTA